VAGGENRRPVLSALVSPLDVPPSVLSDLLGISIGAAAPWSTLSGRDWIDYPRTRLMEASSSE
jgi:hypothetical protein